MYRWRFILITHLYKEVCYIWFIAYLNSLRLNLPHLVTYYMTNITVSYSYSTLQNIRGEQGTT